MNRFRNVILVSIFPLSLFPAARISAADSDGASARRYPEGSERYRKGPFDPSAGPQDSSQNPRPATPVAPVDPLPMPVHAPLRKASAASAIAIDVKPASASVDLYKPLFAAITLSVNYANPFDQADVKLDLVATSPSGKAVIVPCFWKSGTPASSVWEARWTPLEVGEYAYKVNCVKSGETSSSPAQTLTVNPSNLDGFLHMDSTGSFYHFRFDSGKPFRGVGENFGWESGKYTFDVMFKLLKENGVNFVRTWKGPGSYYLEQGTGKAGWYQQDTANRLDKTLTLSEQSGIYLMPTLDPIIEYQTGVDGWSGEIKWQKNPYGTYKGGPCNGPIDFFNGTKAREIYKNRLRYAVARWGYSPNVGVWEFFNEVDWAFLTEKVPTADIAAWHNYMASYLRSIDPYNHIVTTSLSHNDFPDLWSLKNMDFTQRHLYGPTDGFITTLATYETEYKKPFVSGEFSYDWKGVTQHPHSEYEKELHLGLWRGLFLPTPVLPLTWWWDFHADSGDYFHFARVRDFSDKMLADGKSIDYLKADAGTADVETRAIKSERGVFVWLYNKSTGAKSNLAVKLDGVVNNGSFDSKTFDTWKGTYGAATIVNASGAQMQMQVASLAAGADMAIWLSNKAAVVPVSRSNALPEGWRLAFNSTSGELRILGPAGSTEGAGYALLDLGGRVSMSGRLAASQSLSLRGARNGVYVLKVRVGNRDVSLKLALTGNG
jgi:hypothetical protein